MNTSSESGAKRAIHINSEGAPDAGQDPPRCCPELTPNNLGRSLPSSARIHNPEVCGKGPGEVPNHACGSICSPLPARSSGERDGTATTQDRGAAEEDVLSGARVFVCSFLIWISQTLLGCWTTFEMYGLVLAANLGGQPARHR